MIQGYGNMFWKRHVDQLMRRYQDGENKGLDQAAPLNCSAYDDQNSGLVFDDTAYADGAWQQSRETEPETYTDRETHSETYTGLKESVYDEVVLPGHPTETNGPRRSGRKIKPPNRLDL